LLHAQVEFSAIPQDLQMIPRDKNNRAIIKLAGKNLRPEYNQIRSIVKKTSNDSIVEDFITELDTSNVFSIQHRIPVALAEYDLKIYLRTSYSELLVKVVHRITAGDYFIIAGQSNGLAASNGDYSGTDEMISYDNLWIRGIGTHDNPLSPDYPCETQDYNFYQSTSNWLQEGFVGTWGLTLQFYLSKETGIPNCFINGSRAGSTINQNLASQTPSKEKSLDSCKVYDRLFKKVIHYQLDSAIRGIFWYQGESDAALAHSNSCDYLNKFRALYSSWKADYPNLEKIFLLQLNTGCNTMYIGELREIQRRISYQYADVVILSTFCEEADDRDADQCHYTTKGYNKIANNLLPLVIKYMYNGDLNDNAILPPKIKRAHYSSENQLCLEFDMNVNVQQSKKYSDTSIAYIKDYFFGENNSPLNIVSVTSKDNLVYLNLTSEGFKPKKITYLPHSYSFIPTLYTGPWILNQYNTNIKALSFYEFAVTSANDNNWNNVWSNFGSGAINSQALDESSAIYPGDFDGDGSEELFVISKAGALNLFKYKDGGMGSIWSSIVDALSPVQTDLSIIFQGRNHLLVGDFNADGKMDLFCKGSKNLKSPAYLFTYSQQSWNKVWQGDVGGDKMIGESIYAGDFNGDGRYELLQLSENSNNEIIEWHFNGRDFSSRIDQKDNSVPQTIYKNDFLVADFDGDGSSDLIDTKGIHPVYMYKEKIWKKMIIDNDVTTFSDDDNLSIVPSKIVVGKRGPKQATQLIVRNGGTNQSEVRFLSLVQTEVKTFLWRANPGEAIISSSSDWAFDNLFDNKQRFYFFKPVASESPYLLAMRNEACGYFLSLFKYSREKDPPVDPTLLGESNDENDFLIYPNPTSGLTRITMKPGKIYTISILNIQGELLLDFKNQSAEALIDLGFLFQGLYLIKFESERTSYTKKIIKG